ncbi:hypothetical protein [Iningainema tapete]|uniref:Uncharacterized protein n=1 Tax=Iningainema tapete BLCC-T55 TaxID=2748662 RepID=A0A8J6XF43_9CYAN|nr:hypothetical protein [Iningainema tapete]MBD2775445.1 hypothetical protein [Iningainema tapete BLCC-T55]
MMIWLLAVSNFKNHVSKIGSKVLEVGLGEFVFACSDRHCRMLLDADSSRANYLFLAVFQVIHTKPDKSVV